MKFRTVLALSILAVAGTAKAQITAAVAANLQYAFEDLRAEFKKETGAEVKAVYGASGKLTSQIRSGAPFHVFVSADVQYPDSLWKARLAASAPRIYAYGELVLWTTRDLDLSKGVDLVKDPTVKRIGIGDPKVTIYGPAALGALKVRGLEATAAPKIVYGENIAQVGQYVVSGAVDLGFAPLSLAGAPAMKGKGRFVRVDPKLYEALPQAAVVTAYGKEHDGAVSQRFADFLLSPAARTILAGYGYRLP